MNSNEKKSKFNNLSKLDVTLLVVSVSILAVSAIVYFTFSLVTIPITKTFTPNYDNFIKVNNGKIVLRSYVTKALEKISKRLKREREISKVISKLNFHYAVKIGHGKVKMIEFCNIDSNACRKLEKLISESKNIRDRITAYLFLVPIKTHYKSKNMELFYFTESSNLNREERINKLNDIMVKEKYKDNIPPKVIPSNYANAALNYSIYLEKELHLDKVPYILIDKETKYNGNENKALKFLSNELRS